MRFESCGRGDVRVPTCPGRGGRSRRRCGARPARRRESSCVRRATCARRERRHGGRRGRRRTWRPWLVRGKTSFETNATCVTRERVAWHARASRRTRERCASNPKPEMQRADWPKYKIRSETETFGFRRVDRRENRDTSPRVRSVWSHLHARSRCARDTTADEGSWDLRSNGGDVLCGDGGDGRGGPRGGEGGIAATGTPDPRRHPGKRRDRTGLRLPRGEARC